MYKNLKKVISDTLTVSKIVRTNNKKRVILLSVFLSQAIAGADIIIILFFTKILSNSYIPANIFIIDQILEYENFLPLLIVFRYSFQYLQSTTLKSMELRVQNNLKSFLLSEVFEKRNYSVADAYFYINTLAGHISFFYSSIAHFLNFLLQSIAFSIYLFSTDPTSISTFMLGILFLLYPLSYLIKKAREYMHKTYELGQSASHDIQKVVDNMFLIKLLNKEDDEISRFSKTIKQLNLYLLNNHRYSILNSYLPSFLTVFLLSIITIFASSFFNITLPFVGITLRMFQSLGQLSGAFNQIVNSHVHLEKFYEMQTNKPKLNKEKYVQIEEKENPDILSFHDVSFKYLNSSIEIFSNLNISFKRGTHTIITGPNGSGKSTLLGLIAGVYYPTNGIIKAKSARLGYVGPTPLIFSASLKENILYGNNENINDLKIIELIKYFNLFNEDKKCDLNQKVDNKSLSSGQMQKIAFIRALLNDIEILILDESTSNLDENSKRKIFEYLKNKNITIINSTHEIHNFNNYDSHLEIKMADDKRSIVNN